MRYRFKALTSKFWTPNSNYKHLIVETVKSHVRDGDVLVLSEKALSTAKGLIYDESSIRPGALARIIAIFWMRIVWRYFLGPLTSLKPKTLMNLRNYPVYEGAAHKQFVLMHSGILQALRHASEGGIDVSNLPYTYVSIPLPDPGKEAEEIRKMISEKLGVKINVMIADTDMTYSFRNLHFAPGMQGLPGIHKGGGVLTYVACRALRLKPRASPRALVGERFSLDEALDLAEIAHHARGSGAGRSAWEVAEKFGVKPHEVSWEMLESIKHHPMILIRREDTSRR